MLTYALLAVSDVLASRPFAMTSASTAKTRRS